MKPELIVDAARCAHETVDGETMVIDTLTGHLLLFDGIATTLWDHLRAGTTVDGLTHEVGERYGDDAASTVRPFVDEVVAAGLVVPAGDAPIALATDVAPWPDSFSTPTIERFDEIADIMSMDPIHDVDASSGWPHAGADTAG